MKRVALEYAEALFSLACEAGEEERVMTALDEVARVLRDTPEYMELMTTPTIALRERIALLETCAGARWPEIVLSTLQLMCEKGRFRSVPECVEEYRRLLDDKNSVACARVTSAVALTEQEKQALREALGCRCGGAVTLECRVDAALLGGVVIEMNGQVMDGSLRHQLHKVKEVMNR